MIVEYKFYLLKIIDKITEAKCKSTSSEFDLCYSNIFMEIVKFRSYNYHCCMLVNY